MQKIEQYIRNWEPFRDMWEIDKALFIKNYESINPSAQAFEENIEHYTGIINRVQLQETTTNVHFLIIISSPLKTAIVQHCKQWQKQLEELLLKLATNKIEHVFIIIIIIIILLKLHLKIFMQKPFNYRFIGIPQKMQSY